MEDTLEQVSATNTPDADMSAASISDVPIASSASEQGSVRVRRRVRSTGTSASEQGSVRVQRRLRSTGNRWEDSKACIGLQDLQAQIDTLKEQQLAAGVVYTSGPSAGRPEENVVNDDTSSADATDIANIYSFCLEGAFRCAIEGRLAGLAARLALSLVLVFIQVIYAFGYYDASQMMQLKTAILPGFFDPVHESLFYPESVIEGSVGVTTVQAICSTASIFLLAILIKNDTEGTLITVCPLEQLLLCPPPARKSDGGTLARLAGAVGWLLLCVYLEMIELTRAVLVPVMAAMGAAGNFASSSNTQEVVLVPILWTSNPAPVTRPECMLCSRLRPCLPVRTQLILGACYRIPR